MKCRTSSTIFAVLLTTACHAAPKSASAPSHPASPAARAVPALQRDLDAILAQPALEHSYWGVLVRSLKTGETLYALNPRKLMLPASNMKIVTLAAAAERLGWEYTYETQLYAAGAIESGTLQGDLIVVGSGDPSMMERDAEALFAEWAERLKSVGVRSVAGRVIGDDDAFDDNGLGFGWSWDDLPDDYAAGVSALQFNENAVRVTVSPGPAEGDWAGISVTPPGSGLTIVSAVATARATSTTSITERRLPASMRL
jgi:D-alanyl-D-alanine carboxypeptidase/D-alanyl-D-alanine-endopeptidase (penicillin-binding protein 4)